MYVHEARTPAPAASEVAGAAGSPASDSMESATTAAAAVVPMARCHGKGAAACQVPGCTEALAQLQNKAHRICSVHRASPTIATPGGRMRFCQQCNVLHPLYEFSGARRSCQRSLLRRRERRQRYRQQQQEQEQQQRRQQGNGAATGGTGSSADELEAAAADDRSDWGPESQWQTQSDAAQGSISWQPTAGPAPQVVVLTLPAALAAARAAPPARAASWPLEAAWQLDNWQHMLKPTQLPHSNQPAGPLAHLPAHTPPPPPPAPRLAGPPPSWDPATEQQASLLSAQPSLASLQRPPQQWQQPGHQQRLAATPVPPPQVQPLLWQQRLGADQVHVFPLAPQPQLQLLPAESGTAADGQWEAYNSVPGQPAGQPTAMPRGVPHFEHLLPGSTQVQRQDGGLQHALHARHARWALPDVLAWQHSAPVAQPEPLQALQQGGPVLPLPPSMCYAPAKHPALPHCNSCPSLLAYLEPSEAVPSERELLQLSFELGVL